MEVGRVIKRLDRLRAMMGHRFPPMGMRVFDFFFRHIPAVAEVELFPGIRVEMDFSDATQKATYWQGARFEYPATRRLAGWAREGTVFFDIGANYGFFSYWMLSHSPFVTVYAFDPLSRNMAIMARTRERNKLESRFMFTECALGDETAKMTLRTSDQDSGHSSLGCHPGLKGRAYEVDVLTFDGWMAREGLQLPANASWIAKIDVEGFECHVLKGMKHALQAHAFAGLMVEINPYTLGLFGHTPQDVFSLLNEAGYRGDEQREAGDIRPNECFNVFFTPNPSQPRGVL